MTPGGGTPTESRRDRHARRALAAAEQFAGLAAAMAVRITVLEAQVDALQHRHGEPTAGARQDTSVGQAVCGDGPAPAGSGCDDLPGQQGHAAGPMGDHSAHPPTAAKPAVAADHGSPPSGEPREATWEECVRYCRTARLPPFNGDMLVLNRHRAKQQQPAWVLVSSFGARHTPAPDSAAALEGGAP